jgi:uncharacterized protein (TIGR03790 family)
MMKACLAILLFALVPLLALADGGDEVVVIYNKNLPESKAVADYYARLRNVPPKQVFGFSLPKDEVISRADFRTMLQVPLAEKLESTGLWKFGNIPLPLEKGMSDLTPRVIKGVVMSKIRYAVLCYGVPLRIANDPDLHEQQAATTPTLFQGNGAAVDSELVWLPLVKTKPRLSGPMRNWAYGVTNAGWLSPTNGILLVTRLDGPTADIAMGLVAKSLQAEQDGLWGRAYFDARGVTDPAYKVGDDWILGAAQICQALGFETVIDKNPDTFPADFPLSQIAIYAGWYSGNADGPFAQPTVEFVPGAFAYHLHSYSAATLRSTTLNWCGPLLAKGATCTMGCVDEPSIQFTPNVAMFISRWTINHYTYGEAAWAAQTALSWQTTVIGDPLYCPFAKEPSELGVAMKQNHSPLLEWYDLWLVNAGRVRGATYPQMEEFLENLPDTDASAILTEKLADLCDAQGKPETAIEYYQHALGLNPSPEQRIRIRLALGRELQAQNETAAALADYRALVQESPAYPGDGSISNKIAALQSQISPAK